MGPHHRRALPQEKGHWFGLINVMLDPETWANKWPSQTLHILNIVAKGGVVAEMDAFEDMTLNYAHRRHGQGADKHIQPKRSSTMTRRRRQEPDRFAQRQRWDKEHTRKWLREHAPES
jgi:hypothetical protein